MACCWPTTPARRDRSTLPTRRSPPSIAEVRKITAVYVQDMGKADWDHPEGHWIDARTAIYVEGSSRLGSMGPTFGSFSNEEDAKAFIAKYGGKLLHMKDITPEMVDLRGGANMDHSM